ncbi:hypothetical protein OIU93_14565 [Paeniglutamicibacter sp. ZC-3]|uniref:hypothetical protein n=1 Tax=Paeniglutamicibacter sp. ZC-3 TaxID=2986919 RepID=UPI0021F78CA5|nr:hypothetical protein [Paeniglutamicibacter sp. ZC-3]MCV9995509.1 hypothetical protein [Paeniglutamicibacter sp. ZC-3]
MSDALTSIGFGLAGSAALIYVLLRFFVASPNATNTTEAISRHAFWTALIAFLASGTSGLANLWANPSPGTPTDPAAPTMLMHAAAPGLWLGLVYILGQFTWPRHLRPVRSASLEVRRVRDVFPRFLAGFLLLCAIISTALLIVAWNDPGAPSRTGSDSGSEEIHQGPVYDGAEDRYGNPVDEFGHVVDLDNLEDYSTGDEAGPAQPHVSGVAGVRPGSEVGPYLLGGLGLVLLGALGAAAVVVRRPPMDSLDAHDNAVLRSIWINRLLRTAILVVSGFGAAALNYLADGIRARGELAMPLGDPGAGFDSTAQDRANVLSGAGSLCMLLVVVVILAWAPPRLAEPSASVRAVAGTPSGTFAKARDFLLLTQLFSLVPVLAIVLFAGLGASPLVTTAEDGMRTYSFTALAPTRLEALGSLALALLAASAIHLILNLTASRIIICRLGQGPVHAERRRHLLPVWFLVVVSMSVTAAIATITTFVLAAPAATRVAAWWMVGILAVVAALAWALHGTATRRRPLHGASTIEDTKIRIILAHRGMRLLGGVSLLVASILGDPTYWTPSGTGYGESMYVSQEPSGFQLSTLVLGLLLCLLPAATAYPARRHSPQIPSMSSH